MVAKMPRLLIDGREVLGLNLIRESSDGLFRGFLSLS
jgi:hypothetical protein